MKRSNQTSLLALVGILASMPIAAATFQTPSPDQSPRLVRETLAEGIYLLRAPQALDTWTATNVVVIVNDDDVTVFDTFTRPSTARMAIDEIRALTKKPVRTIINSHWHMDHWSGNDEFVKAFPGVEIIATEQSRDFMKRMSTGFLLNSTRTALSRDREELAAAIQKGTLPDGTALTDELRKNRERSIETRGRFVDEMGAVRQILPTRVFQGQLTFRRGGREFQLFSMTGDATGSSVLYLPAEKVLVTGDVLVSPEDGDGPPPWTTNSYAIAPWLASLRRLERFDATIIVPGQGPALRNKAYLTLTADIFAAITAQVQAALEREIFKLDQVRATVNVDELGRRYPSGRVGADTPFDRWVTTLTRKILQESLDGVLPQ